jgi:Flp pilus assembly protein TadG
MKIRPNRKRQKGISLVVTIAGLVWVIMPMLGLVVDLGILYSAKARLQAAVDGAALAAARALTLGQTTAAQALSAQQNAVNWFYANFPSSSNWNTYNTQMNTGTVTVTDLSNLRQVTVTATTTVPAWFMAYFGFKGTTLSLTGQASRKDVVAMLVLDRSGSMCSVNGGNPAPPCGKGDGTPCASMISAAKVFTGSFAAGRDQIGMLTFADGYYLDTAPTVNFQTVLGYTNSSSGNGDIDNITCAGGTGTPAAMSIAYNQLYELSEPGAMNIIMLETDGLPNTVDYNYYSSPGNTSTLALANNSGCLDASTSRANPHGLTVAQGGWKTAASVPSWLGSINMNGGANPGFMANVPAGATGAFYTADPSQKAEYGAYMILMFNPSDNSDSSGNGDSIYINGTANGCQFNSGGTNTYSDFQWLPSQDVFGNQVAPANEYQALALSNVNGVMVNKLSGNAANDWPNTHAAALNATDNSAYNIRSNATLPAYIFVIGLGGNNGDPPDSILLQRMANDPNGDEFNNPPNPNINPCAQEPTCVNYPNQPQGQFIYSPNSTQLGQAFLAISSQILRLSQ